MSNEQDFQWRQTVLHKLDEVAEFFGKTLSSRQISVWLSALAHHSAESITKGFDLHFQTGKYMPKPAEIIDLMRQEVHTHNPRYQQTEAPDWNPGPEHISTAYRLYLREVHSMVFPKPNETRVMVNKQNQGMTFDEAVVIVNRHMYQRDRHYDIENIYQLPDEWGEAV